jgi:hypothetical protein
VEPAQDGTGYFVTRYDVHGTFTTIPGREQPGCTDEDTFASASTGTWNGARAPAGSIPAGARRLHRPLGHLRGFHVAADLADELLLRVERSLIP